MSHIIVKLMAGRSEEAKQALTDKIVDAVTAIINNDIDTVSVAFEEFAQDVWMSEVYEPDILNGTGTLYKKPGYEM